MTANLTPASYWEQRARRYGSLGRGLAAVCSYGMPDYYNNYIEACQRRALLPWLGHVVSGSRSALDVGCGVGRWSFELTSRGYEVHGVDLSQSMIDVARARADKQRFRCEFEVGDITNLELGRRFDLILSVTVVQHVTDPQLARQAIGRLAEHLAPGGRLLLLEAAPGRAVSRCDTAIFKARAVEWYLESLRDAGLTVVAQCGVDPTPLKTWLLPYYRRVPRLLGDLMLGAATAMSLPADLMMARWLSRPSWHKVIVATQSNNLAGHKQRVGRAA